MQIYIFKVPSTNQWKKTAWRENWITFRCEIGNERGTMAAVSGNVNHMHTKPSNLGWKSMLLWLLSLCTFPFKWDTSETVTPVIMLIPISPAQHRETQTTKESFDVDRLQLRSHTRKLLFRWLSDGVSRCVGTGTANVTQLTKVLFWVGREFDECTNDSHADWQFSNINLFRRTFSNSFLCVVWPAELGCYSFIIHGKNNITNEHSYAKRWHSFRNTRCMAVLLLGCTVLYTLGCTVYIRSNGMPV